ncbi:MAG TPA: ATP-binding protein [Ktedonobacterales bacterium]|nr:ATP-binding protein [Ktedonobacterales bacterium]
MDTRDADALKAELLGTVSHELRSPLAIIKGYAATLLRHERRLAPAERREFLSAIVEGSDRLERLINQLLVMSELTTGHVTLQRESLDVAPLLREAIAQRAWQPRPDTERHAFSVVIADAAGQLCENAPRIAADLRLVRTLVDNLLENAVKYTPTGGAITVRVGARQGALRARAAPEGVGAAAGAAGPALSVPALEIAVRDSGTGIPADHLDRIFDRFHRVDTRLTREVDGLGLGLAICERIVALHAGAIWAESQPGKGSTFYVLLPLADEAARP